ncbi:hypothetical protein [Spirosoma harenae]
MPDDFWRKAFDDAAETPPTRVWDAIERRLDESDRTKILPLWGLGLTSSRSMAWGIGVAAAIAVLLLGWWSVNTLSTNQTSVATSATSSAKTTQKSVPQEAEKEVSANNAIDHKSAEKESETIIYESKPNTTAATLRNKNNNADVKTGLQLKRSVNHKLVAKATPDRLPDLPGVEKSIAAAFAPQSRRPNSSPSTIPTVDFSSSTPVVVTPAYGRSTSGNSEVITSQSATLAAFDPLSSRSFRFRDLGQIHRIVWFRAAEPLSQPEEVKSKQKSREVWASASVMPGSFNPMATVKTASYTGASATALDALKGANMSQQSISSRANFSIAYQAGAGVQLSDHWSVESGIGYLAGRSTVETPVQLASSSLQAMAGGATASNLYVDALRNSIHQDGLAYSMPQANFANSNYVAVNNNYNNPTRQVLTNDYQYMQVPVQVGYQLRPKKRLSLALLGGLITNIFIRNTVENEVVITAKDGVYRPLSFAAAMGARFRYRPTRQWSASFAGMYQPSLGLGTQSDSQIQTQPTTTGMSFGVDYHF